MALVFVGAMNKPNYIALSTDIVASKIDGASRIGNTVYTYDDKAWYIIEDDLTLSQYVDPVAVTFTGDLEIGAVEIKDATTATRAVVGANGLAVDAFVNKIEQSVAESTTLSPIYGVQSIAVPGTAEPLVGAATKVIMVLIFTKSTNTDDVYVGTASVDKTSSKQMILPPGATLSIDAPLGYALNLANFYVDAEIAGEGVNYVAMG